MRTPVLRPFISLAICAFCTIAWGQPVESTQSVAEQSGGYVQETYQPGPRLENPPPPYGPGPGVAVRSTYSLIPSAPTSVINQDPKATPGTAALLAPKDFFGRVYKPNVDYYDPYNSSLAVDGHPVGPGDKPALPDQVADLETNPYSWAEIPVAQEMWVTLQLMREGETVFPKNRLPGSEKILQIQRMPDPNSPYLYLRGGPHTTNLNGSPETTTLDLEVEDKDHHVYDYKLKVKVVPYGDPSLKPFVRVNMVNAQLPPVYGAEGSRYAPETAATPNSTPDAQHQLFGTARVAQSGGGTAASVSYSGTRPFTHEETRRFMPIMIGMAKAYDEAVKARAKGYGTTSVLRFQPSTVKNGQPTRNAIPGFKNPYDGQTYFLINGYYFPKYHAILYELSFKNQSDRTIYWDYSLLRLIPGFEPSYQTVKPTAVSPEYGEDTPPNGVNTLWVLCQAKGWLPVTPIRLAFPESGFDGTVRRLVMPHHTPNASNTDQDGSRWSLTR